MAAFPSLGITDMDIVQALLCVLVYLGWRVLTVLRSAGKELGAQVLQIAAQLENLTSLLESNFEDLARSLELIKALILDSERPSRLSESADSERVKQRDK